MSVAEQIGRLAQNLVASRNMVTQKNGTVGSAVAFDNLADEIMSITASEGEQVLVDDTDTAYRKSILNGAQKYAKLKSISGMTYKSSNLFDASKIKNTKIVVSDNGQTITMPEARDLGAITTQSTLAELCPYLRVGDTVYFSFTSTGVNTKQIVYLGIGFVWNKNTSLTITQEHLDSIVFLYGNNAIAGDTEQVIITDFMINLGTTALPYEPYFEGLRDTKVTAIKSYGANIIPFPYYDIKTTSNQGIDFVVDEDGVITVNGTYNGAYTLFDYRLADIMYLPAGDYTVSGCEHGDINVRIFVWIKGGKADRYVNQFSGNSSFKLDEGEYIHRLTLRIAQEVGTINNEVIKPMINFGTTSVPFKPYREPITYAIPEALQGSGKGVAGHNDTVDFENGKDIKKTETIVIDGNEEWKKWESETSPFYHFNLSVSGTTKQRENICSHFANHADGGIYVVYVYGSIFRAYTVGLCPTVDEWKAYLAEQYANGNPVTITYALAEPIETDLAETIGNILEIEEGGFLEFFNKYGNAMPTHISYLRRL